MGQFRGRMRFAIHGQPTSTGIALEHEEKSAARPVRTRLANRTLSYSHLGGKISMNQHRSLLLLSLLTALIAASPGYSADRTPRIEILKNARVPLSPNAFMAQDLSVARHDPSDPNGDMAVHAWYVLKQFRDKHHGRSPQTDLEYAVAVTDWVSSNLRHPAFYPEDPYAPRFYHRMTEDPKYLTLNWEPVRIINYTLKFNPDDPVNWPSPQCTEQNFAAAGLLNYFGLHARMVDVEGHSGLEYYSFQYHKWVWCDSTFNEHYTFVGGDIPLGVIELNELTLQGLTHQVSVVKHGYPTSAYSENTYILRCPHGFRQYATTLYMNLFNKQGAGMRRTDIVVYSPDPPSTYTPLPDEVTHYEESRDSGGWYYWSETNDAGSVDIPLDALSISGPISWDLVTRRAFLSVTSYLPYTSRFEQWSEASRTWITVARVAVPASRAQTSPQLTFALGYGTYTVRLRAVDNVGNKTQEVSFVID